MQAGITQRFGRRERRSRGLPGASAPNVSIEKTVIVALSIVDRDRDLLIADDVLQGLKKEELKYLFMELGLNHLTVKNKYDSTRVSTGIVYWKNGYLRTIVYW